MNGKTNQRVLHAHLSENCISQSCTFTDEQRFVIFGFLLDCSFSVIAGESALTLHWYDTLWEMHAGSFNLQVGFGILWKSRCWSLFVCLTSNINELMCVQLLVELSLDCVLRDGEIWHSCANRKSCNLLLLLSETNVTWLESQCQHLFSAYSWFCGSGSTQVAS